MTSGGAQVNDLFTGTADYYARFRPAYPPEFFEELLRRTVPGGRMLVDLGCGTGELAIPLSARFEEVLAVDVDPDMVDRARAKAAAAGITNVKWVVARAEDVELPRCELITAGASFHWMDRELLAGRAYAAIEPGGAITAVGSVLAPWEGDAPWHGAVVDVIRTQIGERRRAGSQVYNVQRKHEDYLEPAGFRIEKFEVVVEVVWTVDSYLGFLYSTSFAGLHVLGNRKDAFEQGLRAALAEAEANGSLREQVPFYAVIGHKDDPAGAGGAV